MPVLLHGQLSAFARDWLRAHGVDEPDGSEPGGSAAPVGRDEQRRLLQAVARLGGPEALLGLARGRLAHVDEPLVYSLLNSASVPALIDKEQRLNRFFHSHHHVRVLESGEGVLELRHESRAGPRPARVESLFVLGLHLELLEEVGCIGLEATLPGSDAPTAPVFREGMLRSPVPVGDASRWRFTWRRFQPRRAWAPGLDEVLAEASKAPDLARGLGVAERVVREVGRDLAHRWSIDEVARRLGHSRRALQRALALEGTTFSRSVEEARLLRAEAMLLDPDCSITEIGYACGFSDTAHFSRRFKAVRGLPPTAWRSARTEPG